MVSIQQEEDAIVFTVEGWHKLWALRSELRIPRAHIKDAWRDPAAGHELGWRMPGTHIPGILRAGTFYLGSSPSGKPTFFDVQHASNTVVVELADEHYNRLIIEVADPDAVVAALAPPKA
ncbi:MAG: hypothetical protein ACRYFK_19855 [Janthinobacterium lividum]